jgi:ATP-dependent Clp protease ATP-binding subunit ClpA
MYKIIIVLFFGFIPFMLVAQKQENKIKAILSVLNTLNTILTIFGINYENFKKVIINMRGKLDKKDNPKNMIGDDDENVFGEEFGDKSKKTTVKRGKTSKTPVLDNFCADITKAVEEGNFDPVIGREKEIKRVSQILSRRKKNNPVLIGEPGVGKCICSDTEVVMRDDLTGELFTTTISNFLNTISNT